MDTTKIWFNYNPKTYRQNPRCLPVDTILAGKYLVGPVLGQGGFGITYQGYDLNMETRVAIKEYFPVELVSRDTTAMETIGDRALSLSSLSGEKSVTYRQGLEKYVAEAQNVSQFAEMPGVVSVKDFFYENETAYIVMEYIEGESLKDYLKEKNGRLSEEEALAILKPVIEALIQIHKAGIIHRDLSPDNIMLTFKDGGESGAGHAAPAGQAKPLQATDQSKPQKGFDQAKPPQKGRWIESVKLIDFGAARMTAKNDQKSLTIILKHGYAPEEQYRTHGEQGPWTDVYAICAVLYRMLSGETPVPAMDRLFSDDLKSLEALGVKVSKGTSEAVLQGLAVKRENRIQSMEELFGGLYKGAKLSGISRAGKTGGAGTGASGSGEHSGGFRQKPMIAGAAVLAVLLLAAGGMAVSGGKLAGGGKAESEGQAVSGLADGSAPPKDAGQNNGAYSQGSQTGTVVDTGQKEELLGEQIVFYRPQRSVSAAPKSHSIFCRPDGTVTAIGRNTYGEGEVEDWTHVAAVSTANYSSFGLRTDGTVLYAGSDRWGNDAAALWTDLVDIQGSQWCVLGLKKDGTVAAAGRETEESVRKLIDDVSQWKDIQAISVNTSLAAGLCGDGTVVFAGEKPSDVSITGWNQVKDLILWEDHTLLGLCEDGTVKMARFREPEDYVVDWEGIASLPKMRQLSVDGICYAGVSTGGEVFLSSYAGGAIQSEVKEWDRPQALLVNAMSDYTVYGLMEDGSVQDAWENHGNTELEDMKNLKRVDIVRISGEEFLRAYTRQGELLTYGRSYATDDLPLREGKTLRQSVGIYAALYEDGTFVREKNKEETVQISGIKQALSYWDGFWNARPSYAYALLHEDGTVSVQASGDWSQDSLKQYKEYLDSLSGAEHWSDMVQLVIPGSLDRICGLRADGMILSIAAGEEEIIEPKGKIKEIYGSEYVTAVLGITKEGKVETILSSEISEASGMLLLESWENISSLALGGSHTVGLRTDGTVVAAGQNYAGQCEVEDWTDIVFIAAGRCCTLGITADGTIRIAGALY